jgi:hypothetical protein
LVAHAETLGILEQTAPVRRNRKFQYREYIAILAEGTELNTGF